MEVDLSQICLYDEDDHLVFVHTLLSEGLTGGKHLPAIQQRHLSPFSIATPLTHLFLLCFPDANSTLCFKYSMLTKIQYAQKKSELDFISHAHTVMLYIDGCFPNFKSAYMLTVTGKRPDIWQYILFPLVHHLCEAS